MAVLCYQFGMLLRSLAVQLRIEAGIYRCYKRRCFVPGKRLAFVHLISSFFVSHAKCLQDRNKMASPAYLRRLTEIIATLRSPHSGVVYCAVDENNSAQWITRIRNSRADCLVILNDFAQERQRMR